MTPKRQEWHHPDFSIRERQDGHSRRKIITACHQSGLKVYLLPYPGFSQAFAAAVIPFGSIHDQLGQGAGQGPILPGTAHFLEHCLFSQDEAGGLMGRLSALGASANAYTTFDHTMTYFSVTSRFKEAFATWFDALLTLQVDAQRVAQERPIILAELDQYEDDPQARCTRGLIEALYHQHPVRLDIAGTHESVQAIDQDDLKQAWQTFYQPGRLSLTAAGDLAVPDLLSWVADRLAEAETSQGRLPFNSPQEPPAVREPRVMRAMDVATPLFMLGMKEVPLRGSAQERAAQRRAVNLLLDCLLSPVSSFYESLYQAGLINDSFQAQFIEGPGYAFVACGGESPDPEQAAARIQDELMAVTADQVDAALFDAQKKAAAGQMVRLLDRVEAAGMAQARARLHGLDLFDYPLIYDKIDPSNALQILASRGRPDRYALSMVTPRR